MGKPKINVAMIGYKFMGKAHSNAYRQVVRMMNPVAEPVMKLLVGRTPDALNAAAAEFGWKRRRPTGAKPYYVTTSTWSISSPPMICTKRLLSAPLLPESMS